MPRLARSLPDSLRGQMFSVADARALDVPAKRLRASDLTKPFHGTRAPNRELSLLERCQARATRLPVYAAVSHLTAAALHGAPMPDGHTHGSLHFSVPRGARAPGGRATIGHQTECRRDDADRRHGVLVTTPARTFCDLAAMLSLPELVAVGDDFLHRRLTTTEQLAEAARHHPGARGRRRLLRALELLDSAAESPKESQLRVALIEAGLPVPAVNHVVRDPQGRFVARVDLAYSDLKIAIEYEGDHHRDKGQWRRDLQRRRRLEALGWVYIPATQADLTEVDSLLSDIRSAIARSLAATRL